MFIAISTVLSLLFWGFQKHHLAFILFVMQLYRGLLEDLKTTY